MSAGKFQVSFYELNNGDVAKIKVQPETVSGFNVPGVGPATTKVLARVSGGNARYGIKARSFSLRWTGQPPTGYDASSVVRIPILTATVYDSTQLYDTVTYLGAQAQVVGKSPERVR